MSLPYFPMYPTDFEAKTSHLTLEEDGAYNRLLRLMWMSPGCSLPDDDHWIMRRMRVDQETFDRVVRVVIDEFMVRRNQRIFSLRLLKEYQKSSLAHQKRVSAGSLGGKAKALKRRKNQSSNAKAMLYQPEPEPEPESYKKKRDTNVSPKENEFERFWQSVPKKVGKGAARKAFVKALEKTSFEEIEAGIIRYAQSRKNQDPQYTAHPATWLNQERWSDDLSTPENFHDKLKEEIDGLQFEDEDNSGDGKRLPAPIRAAAAPVRRGQAEVGAGRGGGS